MIQASRQLWPMKLEASGLDAKPQKKTKKHIFSNAQGQGTKWAQW